jgi:NAD(P) transhydrogenase subunit alpha
MNVYIPKEDVPGERRVAIVPDSVAALKKLGLDVQIESGAGQSTYFNDDVYANAGATVVSDGDALPHVDLIVKVQRPSLQQLQRTREGAALICFLPPASSADLLREMLARKITAFSMDLIPRISRAQSMDALSSQATVSGYKAVLIAAQSLSKFFPMLTTAAGTIFAAKVLVLGAGVAGLQAIATARRLGAVVWGYDVRPVVKEQVESLGAKFLRFDLGEKDVEDKGGYARQLTAENQQRQQQWLADQTRDFDVVITTALIPGKPAPRLITRETVERMRPGSVIVDLAAEGGGNCELTQPGKTIEHNGVIIHAPLNLASSGAVHASQMYARNVVNLVTQLVKNGQLNIDTSDEVIRGALLVHQGQAMHDAAKAALATG